MQTPAKSAHIMDIVPTVCAILGVDREGLSGQPLLADSDRRPANGGSAETKGLE
jgi:hypothetical protein